MSAESDKLVAGLLAYIERLERENAELQKTADYLGKSNDELCDEVYELKAMRDRSLGLVDKAIGLARCGGGK